MIYECEGKEFWLDEVVDKLLEYIDSNPSVKEAAEKEIVCSAGMTPSCPIHFGIFREVAITSFVVDELNRRGKNARNIYFWDNFDHFCKIPYFTTEEKVHEHVGKMLSAVPDFLDVNKEGKYQSYGHHIMADFEKDLDRCGFRPDFDYQEVAYKNGVYNSYIETVLNKRKEIFDYSHEHDLPYTSEMESTREKYYPLEVYCDSCLRDKTYVTGWNPETKEIKYKCRECGHEGAYILGKDFCGKLAWKVNWATRWKDSKVVYESSGENQLTDTGSYSVSSKILKLQYGREAPFSLLYRFIGVPGVSKLSRALGEKSLARRFTDVLEPEIIRWLLIKNPPESQFSIDIEDGIDRIYNEWDMFCQKMFYNELTDIEKRIYRISVSGVERDRSVIPFNKLCMALAYGQGDIDRALALLARIGLLDDPYENAYQRMRIRIDCARNWLYKYHHIDNVQTILSEFNKEYYDTLDELMKTLVKEFSEGIKPLEKEEDIMNLIYAVPKNHVEDPKEQKVLTKKFIMCLYTLLLGEPHGPRLATLLGFLDAKVIRQLLAGE